MPRIFVDSSVLIDAGRGNTPSSVPALEFIFNLTPERQLLTSPYVWLEVVPKAQYRHQAAELEFYENFFNDPSVLWCRDWQRMEELAREEAVRYGLSALDALHVAAAHLLGADELVTAERPGKALHRSQLVRVSYLYAGLI